MDHLDGNALAGPLADYFSFDVTAALARCNGCGELAEFARALVYTSPAGTVVRCGSCEHVLATLVEAGDRAWLGFSGVSAIEVRRA
jgi:ribosomal protein S27E